jgi:hypothetical protein
LTSVNDSTDAQETDQSESIGEIHIYTFEGRHSNNPTHVATLQFPRLHQGRYVERIIAHSGPFCARPPADAQMYKSNDRRICVISLAYGHGAAYSVYVRHSYLMRYVREQAHSGTPPIVPWELWGEDNSRMLPGEHRGWLR